MPNEYQRGGLWLVALVCLLPYAVFWILQDVPWFRTAVTWLGYGWALIAGLAYVLAIVCAVLLLAGRER